MAKFKVGQMITGRDNSAPAGIVCKISSEPPSKTWLAQQHDRRYRALAHSKKPIQWISVYDGIGQACHADLFVKPGGKPPADFVRKVWAGSEPGAKVELERWFPFLRKDTYKHLDDLNTDIKMTDFALMELIINATRKKNLYSLFPNLQSLSIASLMKLTPGKRMQKLRQCLRPYLKNSELQESTRLFAKQTTLPQERKAILRRIPALLKEISQNKR